MACGTQRPLHSNHKPKHYVLIKFCHRSVPWYRQKSTVLVRPSVCPPVCPPTHLPVCLATLCPSSDIQAREQPSERGLSTLSEGQVQLVATGRKGVGRGRGRRWWRGGGGVRGSYELRPIKILPSNPPRRTRRQRFSVDTFSVEFLPSSDPTRLGQPATPSIVSVILANSLRGRHTQKRRESKQKSIYLGLYLLVS